MAEDDLTIDELASHAKVPSRTIRFYQSRGALMPPTIKGRVAYYGHQHIERLKMIAQLQDRGLSIDAIRDLCTSIDKGELDLAEWLGIEGELQQSWSNDQPRLVDESELYEIAGSKRPGLIADLVRMKLVERTGDRLLVKSPALLAVAMKLEHAGVDLETSTAAAQLIKKHMQRTASDLVDLFMSHAQDGRIDAREPSKMFSAVRPTGIEAVRVIFGREMERAMRKLLESGKIARLPGKAKRTRK
jgi:DNA-binding transcriptional MerR regulator